MTLWNVDKGSGNKGSGNKGSGNMMHVADTLTKM